MGNQTNYTLSNFGDGKTYYFAATAYDQAGYESDFSDEVVYSAPPACTYSVSPTNQTFAQGGGPDTANVTTQSGCSWTAVSNGSWLVITSNSSVTGNGMINYSTLPNSSAFMRTGTLIVAGQSVTITQIGMGSRIITASAGSNGSILPKGNVPVKYGGSQTFTLKPTTYYQIVDVKVDGVSKGAITSYPFSNVTSSHSISASFLR